MIRTGITILLNWAAGMAFILATDIRDPWALSLGLDALAAFVILYHPAGRAQSAIGWAYIAQILIHAVYAVSNHAIAVQAYWQILTWIAFVQLAILGGWIGGFWWHRYHSDRRHSVGTGPHGRESVAQ